MSNITVEGSLVLQVRKAVTLNGSLNLNVIANDMVAVTNASGANNPLTPTLILNGTIVYSSSGTLPTQGATGSICYVSFKCADLIGTVDADDVFSWSINIDNEGGSWRANTNVDLGPYGTTVSMFGLTGIITRKGFDWAQNRAGYIAGGIFGTRDLNRELGFLALSNPIYASNMVTQFLADPTSSNVKTHRDASFMLANLAGITVNWLVPDFPLTTFQAQASMTTIEALSQLASDIGAVLRWNGATGYNVAYPDRSLGNWFVPDCCLIIALQEECYLDLNTGIYSPGVFLVPKMAEFDAGTTAITSPEGAGGLPVQVEELYQTRTLMTAASPHETIDLPLDFDSIYIQNVCGSVVVPGPYTTLDSNEFFELQRGFAGRYVNWNDVGGVLKPQITLDEQLFPNGNSDAEDGNWYMKIAITRKPIGAAPPLAQTDALARTAQKYRFVPICTGSITAAFFGSIPMPGMTVSATLNGRTFTGICESVSFTSPGVITVNYVKWARMSFYTNLAGISNLQLPGFPTDLLVDVDYF